MTGGENADFDGPDGQQPPNASNRFAPGAWRYALAAFALAIPAAIRSRLWSLGAVALGVAVAVPHAEHSFQELIQAADEQLYVAKEAGRNQIQEKVLDYDA